MTATTASPPLASWARRVLALGADGDPAAARERVDAFRRFLLVYGAARSALWVAYATADRALLVPALGVMGVAAALAFVPRAAFLAPRLALPVVAFQAAWRFPFTANHLYLELLCLAVLAFAGRDGDDDGEPVLALAGLRWLAALVLFHTGLQKILYASYWHGDFLAFMAGSQERFGSAFRFLLPADELARLTSLDRKAAGAGPYRVDSWPFLLASNAVVVAELTLPVLLMLRRTRWLGAAGGLALMLGIQVAALEIGFALLFTNLLLLSLPGRWNRQLLPVFAAVLLWAVGASAGWLPGDPTRWNLL